MSEETNCAVCQKPAGHKCGGCHNVYYCSKEHQKSGWKSHKKQCRPFKITSNDILGRFLKATKDIKPGEIVLQENPLIWGPSQTTVPVCLGCCKFITTKNSRPCTKCGWPVCSDVCEKAPSHIPECRYTVLRGDKVSITNFGIVHPTYQCITVLRLLYQKQFLPEVWKKLELLESHCEQRKGTQKYEQERISIAQFIRRFFKLENTFTEDEIMRVCGIVMVNSHEVPLTEPPHIAIYENTSLLEHNCSANCSKSFTNKGGVLIKAGRHIKKGDNLSICYTDPLWGTPSRRHHLRESKFFWCSCSRCVDTTEFGTYFSALRCQDSGCEGFLLPKTFIDNSTNDKGLDWNCNMCSIVLSSYSAQDLLERIGKDLAEMPKGDERECRSFIRSYEELLHPNHYYLTDVKLALAQMIGQQDEGLPAVPDEDLQQKVTITRSLLKLLDTLAPGERRIKGLLLYELHAAISELGRRNADSDGLYTALLESKEILTESAELLKDEPDELQEGKIYKLTIKNLKEIDVILRAMHLTIGDSPS
nr:protein msta-like [Leptinotarsa decemlineata]